MADVVKLKINKLFQFLNFKYTDSLGFDSNGEKY